LFISRFCVDGFAGFAIWGGFGIGRGELVVGIRVGEVV